VFFWGLYFINQELILPRSMEHLYPRDVNMFQHGVVALLMLAELLTTQHSNLSSILYELLFILSGGTVYLLWTLFIVQMDSKWPYPFQNRMGMVDHIQFYGVSLLCMVIVIIVKRTLVNLRWGITPATKKQD